MGQKTNPVGLRLGGLRKWKIHWFLESKNYTDFLLLNYEINKYLIGTLRNNVNINALVIDTYISKISLESLYIFVFFYKLRDKHKERKFSRQQQLQRRKKRTYLRYNLNKLIFKKLNLKAFNTSSKYTQNIQYNFITNLLLNINNKNIILKNKKQALSLKNFLKINKIKSFNKLKIKKKRINNFSQNNINYPVQIQKTYKNTKEIKRALSELTNAKITLILINTLSFINFYKQLTNFHYHYNYLLETTAYQFERFEKNMVAWFRYTVKYIEDVTKITFITLVLKQPKFLAKFLGYQLYKTPRTFRHGKVIFFIIQLIKYIYSTRTEITGLRIQFKGKINGRRRARRRQFVNVGSLFLPTYQSYLEYGCAHGRTRYGTIGIKIWICYDNNFNFIIQKIFLLYFNYSSYKFQQKVKILC